MCLTHCGDKQDHSCDQEKHRNHENFIGGFILVRFAHRLQKEKLHLRAKGNHGFGYHPAISKTSDQKASEEERAAAFVQKFYLPEGRHIFQGTRTSKNSPKRMPNIAIEQPINTAENEAKNR